MQEKKESWFVYATVAGWTWRRTGPTGEVKRAARFFTSREACITDAGQHGYAEPHASAQLPHSAERRRRQGRIH
jgi:hypothetical protein